MPDMEVRHCVIHELIKVSGKPAVSTDIKLTALPSDNPHVVQLVTSLGELIGRKDNQAARGTFDRRSTVYKVPVAFDTYYESENTAADFLAFSASCMAELEDEAKEGNRIAASGGAIVFAEYVLQGADYFLIAMIKQKDALQLDENLVPTGITEIDLSKIHQAARINYRRYDDYNRQLAEQTSEEESVEDLPSYLAFVSPKTNLDVSGYFVVALGCTDSVPTATATKNTIDAVKKFFSANEELTEYKAAAYDRLIDYLKQKSEAKEVARLTEIEHVVRQSVPPEVCDSLDTLVEYLNGEEYGVPYEFGVNKRTLTSRTRMKTKADDWELNFELRILGELPSSRIRYVRDSQQIVISNIPEDVRQKIEEALP